MAIVLRIPFTLGDDPYANVYSVLDDIDADTPEDAARKALEIQRDPQSLAVHFSVEDRDTGKTYEIDLLDRTLGAADDERDSDPAPASGIARPGTH